GPLYIVDRSAASRTTGTTRDSPTSARRASAVRGRTNPPNARPAPSVPSTATGSGEPMTSHSTTYLRGRPVAGYEVPSNGTAPPQEYFDIESTESMRWGTGFNRM